MGTAATMQIEENLAIASRRGKMPTLAWSSKAKQKEMFREMLAELDLGLDDLGSILLPSCKALGELLHLFALPFSIGKRHF